MAKVFIDTIALIPLSLPSFPFCGNPHLRNMYSYIWETVIKSGWYIYLKIVENGKIEKQALMPFFFVNFH